MLDNTVAMWRKGGSVDAGDSGDSPRRCGGAGIRRPGPEVAPTRGSGHDRAGVQVGAKSSGVALVDIQAGHSTLQQELPPLLKYLERADVHLGIDPSSTCTTNARDPSERQSWADDVDRLNHVIQVLDQLVREKDLPPRFLSCHRFRADMVPDAENIRPTPRVQVVMHMERLGSPLAQVRLIQGLHRANTRWHSLALSSSITTIRRAATRCSRNSKCCNCCRIRYISSISNHRPLGVAA